MKGIIILLLLLNICILLGSESQQKASDFTLQDAEGNQVRLSEFKDKLVLLDFWASWCAPCKKALHHYNEFHKKYEGKLIVLAINIDKPRHQPIAQAYIKSNGYEFISLYDPEQVTLKLFNVVNPPRSILVTPDMSIVYTHDGYKRGDELEIEENILKWLDYEPEKRLEQQESTGSNFYISGINKLSYVYRTAEDSLHHYLDNEFSFTAHYNRFRFGISYQAELPGYNRFAPDEYLDSDNIGHEWLDIFGEYSGDKLFVRAGNYEAVFGSGMVIHAYDNTDLDEDTRLDGVQMRVQEDRYMLQGIYGALPNEEYPDHDDIVTGADFSWNLSKAIVMGGSALSYRSFVDGAKYEYNRRDVFDCRLQFITKILELNSEYAESRKYWDINDDLAGRAFYSNMNLYLGDFRITAAYKDYRNFNERLVELPAVSYSEEPIAEYGDWSQPGYDEQGLQGIIFWSPDERNELELNYSEGWASEDDVFMSNFYSSYKHEFSNWGLHLEFSWLERLDDYAEEYKWDREIKPRVEADFMIWQKPVLLRLEWLRQRYDYYGAEKEYSEPLFQCDFGVYKKYSLSILSSLKYKNIDGIQKGSGKLGIELYAPVWEHTDIRLFAGSEKGGNVCRNGVCNYQSPFAGLRLEVTTRF
jgi:cytochrome c biogenesis protein CcmG, thiol:disulfide interchange protein DsbE